MRKPLLRQNSELRADRIWNWTLPAGPTTLPDGRRFNACPNADGCLALCYAREGTFRFPDVLAAHQRNLRMILDDPERWERQMCAEIAQKRFRASGERRDGLIPQIDPSDRWAIGWAMNGGAAIRIHDAGDFFSDSYLEAWLRIARRFVDVLFYAYTKEVERFRRIVEPDAPSNFRWIYSLGGKQDALLDLDDDRHAEVFVEQEDLDRAGYLDQASSDLLAVLLPSKRIGIAANNHPHLKRKMEGKSFGEIQIERSARREAIREEHRDLS